MADIRIELHNISNPHCFVLRKSSCGDVVLKYKNWTRDEEWKPSNKTDDGLVVMKSECNLPDTVALLNTPTTEKIDLARLKTDIPKFFTSRVFEESHKKWWQDFLEDKRGLYKTPEQPSSSWLLDDIIMMKQRQNCRSVVTPEGGSGLLDIPRPSNVPQEVEELVAAQVQAIPEVYSGRYCNPRRLLQRVTEVDDALSSLKDDVLVALYLDDGGKLPVIAKVTSVEETEVSVEYMKGSWRTKWQPWKLRSGEIWSDKLPKTCIILVDLNLGENGKLTSETANFLKRKYKELS